MKALFVGDVCPTKTSSEFFKNGNIDVLFGDAVELFKNNDINMINLECALTEHPAQIAKIGPALKAPKETAAAEADTVLSMLSD